jgi:hypothetical protein
MECVGWSVLNDGEGPIRSVGSVLNDGEGPEVERDMQRYIGLGYCMI